MAGCAGPGGLLAAGFLLIMAGSGLPGAESPAGFTLAVTGDTLGNLEVCGCPRDPEGGLGRRAYALDRYRAAGREVLPVESGGFWTVGEPIDDERTLTYLQGLEMMDYGPVLLAAEEFSHPRRDLEFLISQVDLPFLAANVGTATGEPPWDGVWTGEAGGLEVAVLGLTRGATSELMEREGYRLRDPAEVLRELLPSLRPKTDILIVVTDLGEDAPALVRSVTGIDVLVGGASSLMYQKTDDTFTVFASPEGRSLRLATIRRSSRDSTPSYSVREKHLEADAPEDPAIRAFLDGWYAEVASRPEFAWQGPPPAPGASGADAVFIGNEACSPCHKADYETLRGRFHASAMIPLQRKQRYFIPRCFACHVTGYTFEGGYSGGDPRHPMRGVQCEACHGPGSRHADDPDVAPPIPRPDRSTCETCHDEENSPRFGADFERYWEAAKHTF